MVARVYLGGSFPRVYDLARISGALYQIVDIAPRVERADPRGPYVRCEVVECPPTAYGARIFEGAVETP